MYKVYWTETDTNQAKSRDFASHQLTDMLKFMEDLRGQRRDGAPIAFLASSAENPDSVGQAGVAETGPEYKHQWYKRRDPPPAE